LGPVRAKKKDRPLDSKGEALHTGGLRGGEVNSRGNRELILIECEDDKREEQGIGETLARKWDGLFEGGGKVPR